jgi:hypothetical protein
MLLTKYYFADQTEKNEMSGVCDTYGGKRNVCGVMVGKSEGKPSSRWRYNIKTDPTGVRCDEVDCINLAQG